MIGLGPLALWELWQRIAALEQAARQERAHRSPHGHPRRWLATDIVHRRLGFGRDRCDGKRQRPAPPGGN